jgi:hypothetical protein
MDASLASRSWRVEGLEPPVFGDILVEDLEDLVPY